MTFRQFQRAVGARIRRARWLAGLTQLKAAEKADIDERYYRRLEAGDVNAQLDTLFKLARALGRSASELIDVEQRPSGQLSLAEAEEAARANRPRTGRPAKPRGRRT